MKETISVACPYCSAQPGELCSSYDNGEPHEARKLAAMELDMMSPEKTHVASDAMIEDVAKWII